MHEKWVVIIDGGYVIAVDKFEHQGHQVDNRKDNTTGGKAILTAWNHWFFDEEVRGFQQKDKGTFPKK